MISTPQAFFKSVSQLMPMYSLNVIKDSSLDLNMNIYMYLKQPPMKLIKYFLPPRVSNPLMSQTSK